MPHQPAKIAPLRRTRKIQGQKHLPESAVSDQFEIGNISEIGGPGGNFITCSASRIGCNFASAQHAPKFCAAAGRRLSVREVKFSEARQSRQMRQPDIRDACVFEMEMQEPRKLEEICQSAQMLKPGIRDLCFMEVKNMKTCQSFEVSQTCVGNLSFV